MNVSEPPLLYMVPPLLLFQSASFWWVDLDLFEVGKVSALGALFGPILDLSALRNVRLA